MIKWLIRKLIGYDRKANFDIMPEDAQALSDALSCGNSFPAHLQGQALQVEELPGWMFNGEPTVVARNSDGVVFGVVMSYYDKELQGEVVTVQKDAKHVFDLNRPYFDLKPGEYTVVAVHNEKMP